MADEFTRGAEFDNAGRADGGDEESLVLTQQSHAKSEGPDEDNAFGDLKSNKGRDHATYTLAVISNLCDLFLLLGRSFN